MKFLMALRLGDIKFFLDEIGFKTNLYQCTLLIDKKRNKLSLFMYKNKAFTLLEFYEAAVFINGEEDYELSFDWCSFLYYLFGVVYKNEYVEQLKKKYDYPRIVYIPNGLPEGISIQDTIDKVYQKSLNSDLEDVDDLFAVLADDEYKWQVLNRKALIRRKINNNKEKDKA